MFSNRKYDKIVWLIALLFGAFSFVAIYHSTQKPFLPKEFSTSYPTIINGIEIQSHQEVEFILTPYRVGEIVHIQDLTGGKVQKVPLVNYYSLMGIIFNVFLSFLIFSLGFLVYLKRSENQAAIIFHFTSTALATAMLGSLTLFCIQPWWIGYPACAMFVFSYTMIPVLFVYFTFVFPARVRKNFFTVLTWLYITAIIIACWYSWLFLSAASQHSIILFHSVTIASMVQNGFVFLLIIFGVVNFIYSYINATSSDEKRKIRWILYSFSIGPAPFIFLWAFPTALGFSPWIPEFAFKFFLLIIPVTFAISILKYRVMDIDLFINRSTVYAIVISIGLLVYLGIIGTSARIITKFTTETSLIISTVTAAMFALLFEPARRRVQRFVDRSFFRVQYDFRQAQHKFIEDIKQCFDIKHLAKLIVDRTDEIFSVERIGFFKIQNHDNWLQLAAHKNFDILERHNIRLDAEKLKTRLELPVALDDKIEQGVAHESADMEVFQRWGMALVLPMLSERLNILGFLVLGEKKSGARFTAEDIDLMNTVTTQAGLTIERIELQYKLMLEHAEKQRLEELNRLKSYFVSSVSHDLKTPLTSIKMFAELLRTRKNIPKPEVDEYLEIIEGESERLTRLINNVLDFAKIERGVKKYHFSEIELNSLVKSVMRSLHYQFKIEKCIVHEKLCDKECILNADKDAITEVLINLVSNAIKYSHDEKEITISIFRRDGFVALQVADKGIGIAPEDIQYIFDPFYRARDGKNLGAGGAGLGLAIVKHIMEAHGGEVEVQSTLGKGSTFTLLFPLGLEG